MTCLKSSPLISREILGRYAFKNGVVAEFNSPLERMWNVGNQIPNASQSNCTGTANKLCIEKQCDWEK